MQRDVDVRHRVQQFHQERRRWLLHGSQTSSSLARTTIRTSGFRRRTLALAHLARLSLFLSFSHCRRLASSGHRLRSQTWTLFFLPKDDPWPRDGIFFFHGSATFFIDFSLEKTSSSRGDSSASSNYFPGHALPTVCGHFGTGLRGTWPRGALDSLSLSLSLCCVFVERAPPPPPPVFLRTFPSSTAAARHFNRYTQHTPSEREKEPTLEGSSFNPTVNTPHLQSSRCRASAPTSTPLYFFEFSSTRSRRRRPHSRLPVS